MATPRFVQAAAAVSILTTGAAAYYFLSDGGDRDKLDERLRNTRSKLDTTVTSARNWTAATAATVQTQVISSIHNRKQRDDEKGSTETRIQPTGETKGEIVENVRRREERRMGEDNDRRRRGYCHTCSGPRIWFFAEKLRLKRRFTPYPDPPRE